MIKRARRLELRREIVRDLRVIVGGWRRDTILTAGCTPTIQTGPERCADAPPFSDECGPSVTGCSA